METEPKTDGQKAYVEQVTEALEELQKETEQVEKNNDGDEDYESLPLEMKCSQIQCTLQQVYGKTYLLRADLDNVIEDLIETPDPGQTGINVTSSAQKANLFQKLGHLEGVIKSTEAILRKYVRSVTVKTKPASANEASAKEDDYFQVKIAALRRYLRNIYRKEQSLKSNVSYIKLSILQLDESEDAETTFARLYGKLQKLHSYQICSYLLEEEMIQVLYTVIDLDVSPRNRERLTDMKKISRLMSEKIRKLTDRIHMLLICLSNYFTDDALPNKSGKEDSGARRKKGVDARSEKEMEVDGRREEAGGVEETEEKVKNGTKTGVGEDEDEVDDDVGEDEEMAVTDNKFEDKD